ncbi:nucleoside triphosphate pyrophosphohydrolase [Granulicella tundricola]|uniref:MazG family protein n=1 Tax=Granulicella tundricola (strain ATCC BAA-1859 / DSM 23138 / MP5ACTX9) TaxID=1198114 RepID=E8X4L1_GRATM|nr:nucleoside triphosphate pyrophosphohydrolase [Granulicella tundricola]ADW69421.1 MazG family protein [Granulicella tundricola MP5ACTX9]
MSEETTKVTPAEMESLREAIAIMARLRGPGGCPWDREQTFESIKRHTLEETYEVFDAIDRKAWPELKDELGDLLLQVLFYAQMASEAGYFNIQDVAANLSAKLIRRHPHIFGDASAETADDVNRNWEAVKRQEKAERGDAPAGLLADVPRHVPAMLEATKLGAKAAKVGFDWADEGGLFTKLEEELEELRLEVRPGEAGSERAFDELGDLLFTAMHLARKLKLDPEFALRGANAKFRRRFNAMEAAAGGTETLQKASEEELDAMWRLAKQQVG